MSGEFRHIPVMAEEVIALLKPERGGIFIDGTLGGGGHAQLMLERMPESGRYYGIDRDGEAIAHASERLVAFGAKFVPVRGNFFDMKRLMSACGESFANGILMDLGVSSYQLDTPERGFSYMSNAPLDMRMDGDAAVSAYDVVNGCAGDELYRIIRDYGEERYASRISNAIVRQREQHPIETTLELAQIVKRAMPAPARREAQHPAKRTFQAIRIEVNGELEGLRTAIEDAESLLAPGGVMAVITFHSLEDRIVKQAFKTFEAPCTCDPKAPICTCGKIATSTVLTRKPITAGAEELELNPRSRSAKLRAVQKR